VALKKSELYSSLWSSCDALRGGMDASQYKDYVLVLLFIKYISDKYAGQPFAPITIPPGASFRDMVALKGIYQHGMDYWAETMQDDCYLIAADGWKAETSRIVETDKKGKQKDKGWTCDLVPKSLLVACYFAKEQADIDQLVANLEGLSARIAELEEEHGGEDG